METWTWNGELSNEMRKWLDEAFISLDDGNLLVKTCDKDVVLVREGWLICRTGDGDVIVMSNGAAAAQFIAVEETT